MREYSWIGLAFILFIVLLAANQDNVNSSRTDWYDDGTLISQRDGGNFISGSGISVTSADNPGESRADITIATTGLITSAFAEMTDNGNTDAYVIDSQGEDYGYHSNGMVADDLLNWTFSNGGAGFNFTITGITDAGGGQIEVTTSAAHGLAVGDVITIGNTTDYNSVFIVDTIVSTTVFQVTATFVSTQTGIVNEASTLIAGAGAGGTYQVTWSGSITTATNNETFDFLLVIGESRQTDTIVRRKFGTATDFGSTSGTAIIDIVVGDRVSLCLSNLDSTGNITIRNLTVILHQI